MASTHDFTLGTAAAVPAEGLNLFHRRAMVVDANSSNTNGVNIGDEDTVLALDVAEGDFVLLVALEVLTAEGGTLTIDVGDGDDPDGYLDGVNANATAGTRYVSYQTYTVDVTNADLELPDTLSAGILGIVGGKYYAAADTIDMLYKDAADAAKLRLTAFLFALDSPQTVANARVSVA